MNLKKRSRFQCLLLLLICLSPLSHGKTMLVLGDSLSAAYKMPQQAGWVHLLDQRLSNIDIINASVSGATTAAGLNLLPSLLKKEKPDWVIIQLGANDGLQGKPVPYISKNLEQLIQLSKNAHADVMLIGIQLPPNYGKRYTVPFFNQYATLAEKHALEYIPFLLEGVAGNNELMQEDGLHPNQIAQEKVLAHVFPSIEKFVQQEH